MDASLIRQAREQVGESQAAFAQRFGVDQSTVHRWETDGPPARGAARRMLERELQAIADEKASSGDEGALP
ncbi:helix-turn-helix domain-containing protein [Bradyrhizobium sp. HKCCYLRH3099]|uniref:helix-turn-helix domain-containing protein n=1 Tax=unclassified Bradyrhizobium TaxID=2631580 RepID=UPI003EBE6917